MKLQIKQILAFGILLLAVLPQGLTAQMMAWEDNYGAVFDGGWLDAAVIETTTQQPEPSPSPSPEVVPYEENVPAPPLGSPSPGYHENPYGPLPEDPDPKKKVTKTIPARPAFRAILKHAIKKGGKVVMHGQVSFKTKKGKRPKKKRVFSLVDEKTGKRVGTMVLSDMTVHEGYVVYHTVTVLADQGSQIDKTIIKVGGFNSFNVTRNQGDNPTFPTPTDNSEIPYDEIPLDPSSPIKIESNTPPPPPPPEPKTWYQDIDGDGYYGGTYTSVDPPPGRSWSLSPGKGKDCEDRDPNTTTECVVTFYVDWDGDGYHGEVYISNPYPVDTPPPGSKRTTKGEDCDDNNPFKITAEDCKPFKKGKSNLSGVTKDDTAKLQADINSILVAEKFTNFRNLIKRGKNNNGRIFDKINLDDANEATKNLRNDDILIVKIIMEVLKSDRPFDFEYANDDNPNSKISSSGTRLLRSHFDRIQPGTNGKPGFGSLLFTEENASTLILRNLGGAGFNVPTEDNQGSHSFILQGSRIDHFMNNRAITTFHEIFGHGLKSSMGASSEDNNNFTIRFENLVRRILGINEFRTGANHAGGEIENPTAKPSIN